MSITSRLTMKENVVLLSSRCHKISYVSLSLADLGGGGLGGLQPPFEISKIKESNKTKQKK